MQSGPFTDVLQMTPNNLDDWLEYIKLPENPCAGGAQEQPMIAPPVYMLFYVC